ncbi:MAG: DUF5668 domain-containing protein [Spirochaetaceae bacterium]|jgi:hypothetical protein|nr:DUF5668 domain-containing protein [Spirochaetaceae bacterium]
MVSRVIRRIIARFVFFSGLLLMVFGSAYLLGTFPGSFRVSVVFAFLSVIIGVLCAMLALKLNKRSLYLFFAAFFILLGFFLFFFTLKIIPMNFSQAWPFLSVFTGLALFPAGWHRYGKIKIGYTVSSMAFIALGCLLLIFSFDVVQFTFKKFILQWWPLILILAGVMLVLVSLGTKSKPEDAK